MVSKNEKKVVKKQNPSSLNLKETAKSGLKIKLSSRLVVM